MLVLGRYINQSIYLEPGNVKITITDITRDGLVKIGFTAPPSTQIVREELLDRRMVMEQMRAEAEEKRRRSNGR